MFEPHSKLPNMPTGTFVPLARNPHVRLLDCFTFVGTGEPSVGRTSHVGSRGGHGPIGLDPAVIPTGCLELGHKLS